MKEGYRKREKSFKRLWKEMIFNIKIKEWKFEWWEDENKKKKKEVKRDYGCFNDIWWRMRDY